MNRRHIALIALLIGAAAILGAFATMRTVHLGAAARKANQAQIVARTQRLRAGELALRRALGRPLPARAVVGAHRAQKIIYVRPAPIVIHTHHAGGEHEASDGGESGD